MRFPFSRLKEDAPLRLSLPPTVSLAYAVFWDPPELSEPFQPDTLLPLIREWILTHAPEPLRSVLPGFLDNSLLSVQMEMAFLPPELLQAIRTRGLSPAQEQQIFRSRVKFVVTANDLLRLPRLGFWAAYVGARALAERLNGVAIDLNRARVLSFNTDLADMQTQGLPHLRYFLNIPQSVDGRGLGWMTTEGMKAFGLPELQVKDVPPAVMLALTQLLCGVCQQLIGAVMSLFDGGASPTTPTLTIGPVLLLSLEDVSLGWGEMISSYASGAKESVPFRLAMERGQPPVREEFLTLLPSAECRGTHGEWLHSLIADLIGHEETGYGVAGGDSAMTAAHTQALAELPAIKQHFQAGLAVGERLAVKYGFPLEQDKREYMWVMVNTWQGETVQGHLANEPNFRRDLRPGHWVELPESEIYDWLLYLADGTTKGGYTNIGPRT